MPVKRVTPEQALELMRAEGYSYLDVRSVPEFDEGHPEGAYNVPLLHWARAAASPIASSCP
jgi:rhodanese-related sulfurtransferase